MRAPISRIARRSAAFLLDILIIFGICAPSGYLILHLIGYSPKTGLAVWLTILINFSLPTWIYFLVSDRSKTGKTVGKRLFKLKVISQTSDRIGWGRALSRTAIKLLPWEIIHFSAFALSKEPGMFAGVQYIGLAAGNTLAFVYFIACAITQGKRSMHDFIVDTKIQYEKFQNIRT